MIMIVQEGKSISTIRARFQLSDGPGSQGTIAAQFNCEGTTLSGVEFELVGIGYRVSLVKRRFVSGNFTDCSIHCGVHQINSFRQLCYSFCWNSVHFESLTCFMYLVCSFGF